ncbi:hypothetical protein IKT18_01815 [Candidatus Saccharibacteria bacterium]|nr:hypothetical protein [Candidatus Saccharibacteria bacterium]
MEGIEIVEITPFVLRFKGVGFNEVEKIMYIESVCHKYKHVFMEGFPCGRKTRKRLGARMKRWQDYPGICLTYLVTPRENNTATVRVLVSSVEKLLSRYTRSEVGYFVQLYLQYVAEEVVAQPVLE